MPKTLHHDTQSPVNLSFLGAAREVTGSCYLIEAEGVRFLVDCGMFQGGREARAKNEYKKDKRPFLQRSTDHSPVRRAMRPVATTNSSLIQPPSSKSSPSPGLDSAISGNRPSLSNRSYERPLLSPFQTSVLRIICALWALILATVGYYD